MRRSAFTFLMGVLVLSGCAAIYTDASDANHVTFLNSSGETLGQLTQKANAYCAQYGKTASLKKEDSTLLVVFNCNAVRH